VEEENGISCPGCRSTRLEECWRSYDDTAHGTATFRAGYEESDEYSESSISGDLDLYECQDCGTCFGILGV
jgi:hypothetical protein